MLRLACDHLRQVLHLAMQLLLTRMLLSSILDLCLQLSQHQGFDFLWRLTLRPPLLQSLHVVHQLGLERGLLHFGVLLVWLLLMEAFFLDRVGDILLCKSPSDWLCDLVLVEQLHKHLQFIQLPRVFGRPALTRMLCKLLLSGPGVLGSWEVIRWLEIA